MTESSRETPAPPPPAARPRFLASTLHLLAGTFASQGSNFLRTFLAARVLGPEAWGVWLGLRLIVDYGAVLDLGVNSAILRQVAVLRGRNDDDGVRRALRTSFTFGSAMGLVGGLAVLLWSLARLSGTRRTVVIGIAVLLVLNQLRVYYNCNMRAHQRFREVSLVLLVGSFGSLATLPLLWTWGLEGFIAGMLAQGVVELALSAMFVGPPTVGIDVPSLRRDLVYGLPVSAIVLLALSLGSMDRLVILETLGADQLGYYGVALIAVTLVQNLAAVPNMVMSPRVAEEFGRTGRREALVPVVRAPMRPLSEGFSLVVGAFGLALPVLVELFLPKYAPGVRATRIAMLGAFAAVGTGIAASTLGALDRVRLYLAVLLVDTAITYGVARLLVRLFPSLEAVAAGWAIGTLWHMTAMQVAAFLAMGQRVRDGIAEVARILAPLVFAVAAALGAEWSVRQVAGQMQLGGIARAALAELLFVVLVSPLLVRLARYVLRRRK